MTVYVITEGEYSDYHIVTVFTDREQALLYCATHDMNLEEWETDTVTLASTKPVWERWVAKFDYNHNFIRHWSTGYSFGDANRPRLSTYYKSDIYFLHFLLPIDTSEEIAEKTAKDLFYKLLSQAGDAAL